ncbi:hypothetical protein SDC9_204085 [bioreactor metagenome]|uniref:Uncharacterized protein n=1 Tax=bioreactor metagenome TaxID=1076179 RepID=A0A645IZ04_9ZZZZ
MMVRGITILKAIHGTFMKILHDSSVIILVGLIDKGCRIDLFLCFFAVTTVLYGIHHHGSNLPIVVMVFQQLAVCNFRNWYSFPDGKFGEVLKLRNIPDFHRAPIEHELKDFKYLVMIRNTVTFLKGKRFRLGAALI